MCASLYLVIDKAIIVHHMCTSYVHIICTYLMVTGTGVGDVVSITVRVGLLVGIGMGAGVVGDGVNGAGVNGILPCNRRVKKRVSSSSTLLFLLLLYLILLLRLILFFFLLFAIRFLLCRWRLLLSSS